MRRLFPAAAGLCLVAAGCAQLFGIDPPNDVSPDAATGDSTQPGQDGALDATSADADAAAAADGSDAPATEAGDAAEAAADADAGKPCVTSQLFPSTGSVYCPNGPDGSTLSCPSGVQQCCYGGAIDGGYAPSECDPVGSTCTNGSGPQPIECVEVTDCGDGGLVCCAQFNAPTADSCGNLKGNLKHVLCEATCVANEVAVCESPLECDAGMQCLPIHGGGITFAYCASSLFTVSPQVPGFGAVTVGTPSAPMGLTIKNNSPSSQLLGIAIGGSAFAITANQCTNALPAGLPCSISVTFTPLATGPVHGTLVVSAGGAPVATALLTGTGQ